MASVCKASALHKDPFEAHRWRCITSPARAAETLSPYAKLQINLVKAANLLAVDPSLVRSPTSDPYVEVFLDDVCKHTTAVRNRTLSPTWEEIVTLDIVTPMSMVRLHVMDKNTWKHDVPIGFVEFCVRDLPFDDLVEGWLELRLQKYLRSVSTERYQAHQSQRDDDRRTMTIGARKSILSSISRSEIKTPMRHNAGEIYTSLCLVPLVSPFSRTLALSLDAPAPFDFGITQQQEDVSLQSLLDDWFEILQILSADLIEPVSQLCAYISTWRNMPLSLLYTLSMLAMVWNPYDLFLALSSFLLLVTMVMLGRTSYRQAMTLGSQNTPLSDAGFRLVCNRDDSSQVEAYILRIVTQYLHGSVTDNQGLRNFAQLCFRNGEPALAFSEMCEELRRSEWADFPAVAFTPGTLVLIDNAYRAIIVEPREGDSAPPDSVFVEYDIRHGRTKHQLKIEQSCAVPVTYSHVALTRLTLRTHLPRIPSWVFVGSIGSDIRWLQYLVQWLNESVFHISEMIYDIIARNESYKQLSLLVYLVLCICTLLGFLFKFMVKSTFLYVIEIQACRLVVLAIWFPVISSAWWLQPARAIFKIAVRTARERQLAPDAWAFLRPTEPERRPSCMIIDEFHSCRTQSMAECLYYRGTAVSSLLLGITYCNVLEPRS